MYNAPKIHEVVLPAVIQANPVIIFVRESSLIAMLPKSFVLFSSMIRRNPTFFILVEFTRSQSFYRE